MISARLQPQRPICAHPHLSSTSHPKRVGNRNSPSLWISSGLTVSTQILRLRPGFRLVLTSVTHLRKILVLEILCKRLGAPYVSWLVLIPVEPQQSIGLRWNRPRFELFDLGVDQQSGGDVVIELK
ncbi:hypothetical protein PGT21_001425 [Puccinia graminis f. sp. tritici]|uniref:Uncharacterized protein n=1 Tax=Puccinia graminis f. sp. tritici TaxID=56615 RepID=A0A5B0MAM3_PUCGR|nr:hypothetical protein PGT21_001425 [Puccinia graminis f. sp. tritici]